MVLTDGFDVKHGVVKNLKVICPQCQKEVELIKHINKCECGARIKVLDVDDWLNGDEN